MNAFRGVGCFIAVIAATLVAGCSSPKSEPVYADVPGASSPSTVIDSSAGTSSPVVQANENASETAEPAVKTEQQVDETEKPELIVTPDETLIGSIVSVNEIGRFVVMRFPLGRMPAENSTLFVYRQGMKVAELKVTGPQKDDHTVADIKTGECRPQDEVRDR